MAAPRDKPEPPAAGVASDVSLAVGVDVVEATEVEESADVVVAGGDVSEDTAALVVPEGGAAVVDGAEV